LSRQFFDAAQRISISAGTNVIDSISLNELQFAAARLFMIIATLYSQHVSLQAKFSV
jgi:putative Ca2+/H+ antiporter (TMEM165/GDT1 family)